jgi:hypothetical protein
MPSRSYTSARGGSYGERLAGDPRRDDVRVVAAAHGGEAVGPLNARPGQDIAVEAHSRHPVALEGRAEPAEGLGVLVDDRNRVAAVL